MDGFGKNNFKKLHIYDIKDDDINELKGDTKYFDGQEPEENELLSLKLTAQIHYVNQKGEVIKTVLKNNRRKVYGGKQMFIHKKKEQNFEALELVNIVEEDSLVVKEQKTETCSSQDPLRFICPICTKSIVHKSSFFRHIKIHNNEKKFVCSACNKSFYTTSNLSQHTKIHKNPRFRCEQCEKTFVCYSTLTTHVIRHTGFKGFSCEVCKATFTTNASLLDHMNTHTKHRPYKCDLCPKEFCHSPTLRKHKKGHLNEKPHNCKICNWGFIQKCQLASHRTTKHANLKI